jgi:hypothetical protein
MARAGASLFLAVLVVAALGAGYLAVNSGRQASTSTSTSQTRTTSNTEVASESNATTVSSDGLRLSTAINSTQLAAGQSLSISISLVNTLSTPVSLQQGGYNFTFYGVPVSTWPECTPGVFSFGWRYPIETLVLKGNYTAQQLTSLANVSLSAGPCERGVGASAVPTYTFEPDSMLVNVTYFADGGAGFGKVGVFPAATSLVLGGYWDLATLQRNATSDFSNPDYVYDYCISAVSLFCEIPQSSPFYPGAYTIGVSDEWGQFIVLHFSVEP